MQASFFLFLLKPFLMTPSSLDLVNYTRCMGQIANSFIWEQPLTLPPSSYRPCKSSLSNWKMRMVKQKVQIYLWTHPHLKNHLRIATSFQMPLNLHHPLPHTITHPIQCLGQSKPLTTRPLKRRCEEGSEHWKRCRKRANFEWPQHSCIWSTKYRVHCQKSMGIWQPQEWTSTQETLLTQGQYTLGFDCHWLTAQRS